MTNTDSAQDAEPKKRGRRPWPAWVPFDEPAAAEAAGKMWRHVSTDGLVEEWLTAADGDELLDGNLGDVQVDAPKRGDVVAEVTRLLTLTQDDQRRARQLANRRLARWRVDGALDSPTARRAAELDRSLALAAELAGWIRSDWRRDADAALRAAERAERAKAKAEAAAQAAADAADAAAAAAADADDA